MAALYNKFEMPEKITIEEATDNYGKFITEPFERGFGHTIGNSLRRMLLTSIEAPAIISVAIEGVPHEYMAVEGILEDMTTIILNIKDIKLRRVPTEENEDRISKHQKLSKDLEITEKDIAENNGQVVVKVKDILSTEMFEVINPDHEIFTATKPMKKKVAFRIAYGRGYVPSERHVINDKTTSEIVIDSTFSPVELVNYYVENTRVGQDTDYDKLILEITTDGRISPKEALSFSAQIGIKHLEVFLNLNTYALKFQEEVESEDSDRDEILQKLGLKINEIELSVRSTNCLNSAQIQTIGELVVNHESEMLKYRNFGKKSLNEIKDKLNEMGLSLGMDLSRYSITKDNVKDILSNYEKEEKLI
ncbi:MAG: DNA-directed RNA polymerase subunit alpha [Chlamydiae bacterium]|nr:DNA-directed RNA polymerase subunit alpha [Chlamydiota bacterium]